MVSTQQAEPTLAQLARLDRAPLHIRFSAADGRDVSLGTEPRPSWRGRIHMMALCVFVPATLLLLVAADTARARVGVAIYAGSAFEALDEGEWWPIDRLDEAGLPTLFAKAARLSTEGLLMTPRTTETDGFFVSVLRRA